MVHLLPGRKNSAESSIGRRSRLYAQRLIILTVHHNIRGHDRSGGGNGESNKDNLQSGTGGGEQIFREMAEQACAAIVLRFEIHADPDFFFRSEEHTSELQSLMRISYAVFCLKKKKDDI